MMYPVLLCDVSCLLRDGRVMSCDVSCPIVSRVVSLYDVSLPVCGARYELQPMCAK